VVVETGEEDDTARPPYNNIIYYTLVTGATVRPSGHVALRNRRVGKHTYILHACTDRKINEAKIAAYKCIFEKI
jgi:hypothetical protein